MGKANRMAVDDVGIVVEVVLRSVVAAVLVHSKKNSIQFTEKAAENLRNLKLLRIFQKIKRERN